MAEKSISEVLNEIINRIRLVEGNQTLLNEKLLVTNKSMIEEYRKLTKEIKAIDFELKELKNELENVKKIIKHMTDEIGNFAKKEKVDVLEKYINLWNPIKFVTEKEVREIVKEELEKVR